MPNLDVLPNSIPRNPKVDWSFSTGGTRWLYLFCASCGCDGGRVMETEMPENFAFYLCGEKQNNCAAKWANLSGTMMIPDSVFGIQSHDQLIELMEKEKR